MRAPDFAISGMRLSLRYGVALSLVAIALLLSLVLQVPFGNPFWIFFPAAVIASTWIGGRGPGWVAVGLSTLAVLYYFTRPVRTFTVKPADVPFFLTFVICESVASWVIAWRKRTEDSLRRNRDELELRVAERTAELKSANEALLGQMEEQQRTATALQVTRGELARIARITMLGELTASIAHEVNQPLAAVVANADACVAWLSHPIPDLVEARAAAERSIQGATRASDVISRIRALISKTAPQLAPVHINGVIKEAIALAGLQASRGNVAIALDLAEDLPPVLGDRIQLQQVLLNLLMNGIEASTAVPEERRCLRVCSSAYGNGQVCVSVQDRGIGVHADAIPRLFEPFFTTRSQGIGMGLPISLSIVESHGGRLWAESILDQGSIFRFTLPSDGGAT